MKNILIFCEGKVDGSQSLDIKILSKLLLGIEPKTIIPVGGKGSLFAYMDGYIKRGGVVKPDFAFGLRDRDFDFPIPSEINIIKSKSTNPQKEGGVQKRVFATYKTCMENYLLEPQILTTFITQNHKKLKELDVSDVSNWLKESAFAIRYYTAARHALGKVQIPIDIASTWTKGSGNIPTNLGHDFCLAESIKIIEAYRRPLESVTIDVLKVAFSAFSTIFDSQEHYDSEEYLVYSNGKDIVKSFNNVFNAKTKQSFPNWEDYYDFAIKEIDFKQFADLKKLFDIIEQASKSE